jgi:hypothetical protein
MVEATLDCFAALAMTGKVVECLATTSVFASVAKQSSAGFGEELDCFVACGSSQ